MCIAKAGRNGSIYITLLPKGSDNVMVYKGLPLDCIHRRAIELNFLLEGTWDLRTPLAHGNSIPIASGVTGVSFDIRKDFHITSIRFYTKDGTYQSKSDHVLAWKGRTAFFATRLKKIRSK
jgi:hypothetical protein